MPFVRSFHRILAFLLVIAAAAALAAGGVHRSHRIAHGYVTGVSETPEAGSISLVSPAYRLDRYYRSMHGPNSNLPRVRLSETAGKYDTLWITGVAAKVVSDGAGEPVSPEYFCHANLTLSPGAVEPETHNRSFDPPRHADWRLFTLVPGRMTIDLPDGFGIPIRGGTPLDYYTMSLNQGGRDSGSVRFRTEIRYRKDSGPLRPLFRRALYVYQQHREEPSPDAQSGGKAGAHPGQSCADNCLNDRKGAVPSTFSETIAHDLAEPTHPGARCCVINASEGGVVDQFGTDNTIHWMVPPGAHTYRSEVAKQFELPFDTTAHYVTGHLHPYGKSLRLVDLESGEVVFEIVSEDFTDRPGVKRMSEIRLPEGRLVKAGHRYELVADYENPLPGPIDAMAILYVYLAEEPGPDAALADAGAGQP